MLEGENWEANNLQDSNSRKHYLQEQGKESAASGNASGKNVKEGFMEKTKITNNVKTTSLSHSTKQGNSNSNISNRIRETRNSIGSNIKGLEDKKNVNILRDNIMKHVNGYDIAEKLNKCKVFVKSF